MPDIDPAALSRAATTGSGNASTPILPAKSLSTSVPSTQKAPKSGHIPLRIDLEPLYTALKLAIGENWGTYKDAISLFVMGMRYLFIEFVSMY